MTAQSRDSIIINNKEYSIYNYPLESYWKLIKKKPELSSFTTDLNRGYFAKWLIENKKMYLIDFYGESIKVSKDKNKFFEIKEYNLIDIFPTLKKDKIFASWFSGNIRIPLGNLIDYRHSSAGAIFEYETTLQIEMGKIVEPGVFIID